MPLNDEEKRALAELQRKAKEPAAPAVGKTVSINVDLGDEKQVKMAQRYGFLPADEEPEETAEEEEEEGDETPKRRGYFD